MTKKSITIPASGSVIDIPLNKLRKSPRNVRKVPHPQGDIDALAASIHVSGMLQNPVVEPELEDGTPTGFWLVTIGEGRRLAQLLRVKRKQIAKTEPVRCVVNTVDTPEEISLAENAIRSAMHPADQFEAFLVLHRDHGMNAEGIAANFGVTPAVVKQRLKLATVSPALIKVYREDGMTLDQLTAYAICDDHARQENVWHMHGARAEREDILELLNGEHVSSTDPRARFVGEEAYVGAGGAILRDLFEEEGESFFTDPVLLDRLATEKLEALAASVRAEGWKWVEVMLRQDHAFTSEMRRVYPDGKELSEEEQATLDALEAEYNAFENDGSDEGDAELDRLERAVEAARGEDVFAPEDIARGGVVVTLDYHGEPVVLRGYIRPGDDTGRAKEAAPKTPRGEGPAPLSDKLVAELTAHRTLALRDALGQNARVALAALTHALAHDAFYHGAGVSCLAITLRNPSLLHHAPGIADTPTAQRIEARHEGWARRMPQQAEDLWGFVMALPHTEQLALLAHCVGLSVDAVNAAASKASGEDAALPVAQALSLDMAAHWQPTPENYLGRVPKDRILEAVREAVSPEAADNIANLKKQAMAEAAAARLKDTHWLPPVLRTPQPTAIAAV